MLEKFNKKKLAGVILAVVLTVVSATSAFAADQANSNQQTVNQSRPAKMDFSKMSATIKTAIDSLVTAGTITQAQADAVIKAYTPGEGKGNFQRDNVNSELIIIQKEQLDSLVKAGTITQAQADAIQKISKSNSSESLRGMRGIGHNKQIDELVTAKTITQAQADAINTAIKTGRESQKSIEDVLKELVTAGTITQAQSDAVAKVCTPDGIKGNPPEGRKNNLNELVKAGTITQAQADAISTAVKSAMDSSDKQ